MAGSGRGSRTLPSSPHLAPTLAPSSSSFTSSTSSKGASLRQSQSQHSSFSSSTVKGQYHEPDASSIKSSDGTSTSVVNLDSGYSIPSSSSSTMTGEHKYNTTGSIFPRDDWWEHVLPPGQLAERLRKAQASTPTSSSSSSPLLSVEDVPRSSRRSILRNATPADRKTWTSLSDFGQDSKALLIASRSGETSTRSSIGSIPSIRSDISSISTVSSNAEDSAFEALSPSAQEDVLLEWERERDREQDRDRSTAASPTSMLSIHRSTSLRRSRVVGEHNDSSSSSGGGGGGIGLGLGNAKASEVDDRLRQWNFDTVPATSAATSNHSIHLRPFPSTTTGRQSPLDTLENASEVFSDEEMRSKHDFPSSSSTKTNRTIRQSSRTTSSIRRLDSLLKGQSSLDMRQSMPISSTRHQSWIEIPQNRPDRHVSFHNDRDQKEQWQKQHTIGRGTGRTQSLLNVPSRKRQVWQQPESSRRSTKVLSYNVLEPATPSMHFRERRRTTSYSAPNSPKTASNKLQFDQGTIRSATATPLRKQVRSSSTTAAAAAMIPHDNHDPQLALYSSSSSIGLAQTRMASAGNIALTLTRQLSVPLRPMLQLTMFLSISSFTFMALAGFLIVGYLFTLMDDVNNRGKQIQSNVNLVSKKVEAGFQWCESLFTGQENSSSSSTDHQRLSSSIVTAPIRFAFAVPTTIAYKLTPTSISESLGFTDNATPFTATTTTTATSQRPSSSGRKHSTHFRSSSSSIPPRPPLSSLLPSIFLTIMIALGAGLASLFASRFAATTNTTSTTTTNTSPFSSTAPLSPPLPPHPSSHASIRKRSSVHLPARRHSYHVVSM